MHIGQPLVKCDVAIAMGSHDLRTAAYAAQLVLDGWAPFLICSGSSGRLTDGIWKKTEAVLFAEEAQKGGLPAGKILLEEQSTNTSENLIFSTELLKDASISCKSVLLVHKPYMERRVWATAGKVWPRIKVTVTSPPIPFNEYPTENILLEQIIQIMVGDFQRVLEYPKKGYAIIQDLSDEVMGSFELLKSNGFDEHLL